MAGREDFKRGARLLLRAWPEEGIEHDEVVVIDDVDEDCAYGTVPVELRGPDDFDGIREIPLDDDTFSRTEVL